MQRKMVKNINDLTEEINFLLQEIKKIPDEPDAFDSHCAVEYAKAIRSISTIVVREADRLYAEIVKL